MFSLLAYILRQVNPRVVLAAAALLYILRVQTGSVLLDEFSSRAIFFAAGWVLAPLFFASARWAIERPTRTTTFVLGLGLVNLAFIQLVDAEQVRLAGLVLGLAGAGAMAMLSAWLAGVPLVGKSMARALGRRSLVIYVAFTFPMAAFRALWVQADVLGGSWLGIGVGSVLITLVALVAPLVLEKNRFVDRCWAFSFESRILPVTARWRDQAQSVRQGRRGYRPYSQSGLKHRTGRWAASGQALPFDYSRVVVPLRQADAATGQYRAGIALHARSRPATHQSTL